MISVVRKPARTAEMNFVYHGIKWGIMLEDILLVSLIAVFSLAFLVDLDSSFEREYLGDRMVSR